MRISTPQELREAVSHLLRDRPDPATVRSFFDLALRLAQAHLRHSRSQFRFRSEIGINSLSDLALDSISDLFERNDEGAFVRLQAYYFGIGHADLSDLELWSATRRLISSAVSDAIFRSYRSADPSLAKIIRNLKRGISFREDLKIVSRMGRSVLASPGASPRSGETWTVEVLSVYLLPSIRSNQSISAALTRLSDVLMTETRFDNWIRLSEFALAMRACCVALHEAEGIETEPTLFSPRELDMLLDEAISISLGNRKSFYMSKKKYSEDEFDRIVEGVRIRLRANISASAESGHSNFNAFAQVFPGVTHEVYRSDYRNVFEYFHRIAFDCLIEQARAWSSRIAS